MRPLIALLLVLLFGCKTVEYVVVPQPCVIPCMPDIESVSPDHEKAAWCLTIDDVDRFADWLEFVYIEFGGCDED